MQQFVEQGTMEGAWKGAGSYVEGSVPISLRAALVVRLHTAQPPAPLYPSYPACQRIPFNPAPREDAALPELGLWGQWRPLTGPEGDASLSARGGCWHPQVEGLQEEDSSLHSTMGGTKVHLL